MNNNVRIAGVQMNPIISDVKTNLKSCAKYVEEAAASGAKLVIFPEAALSGYCFNSLEEAKPFIETVPGSSTDTIMELCRAFNVYVIAGTIENDGNYYYNTSIFIGPKGLIGKYHKLHLPYLGIDRFLNHGNGPLTVYDTEIGKIGMSICYDVTFPEQARILALKGADIIVNITDWPGTAPDPNLIRLVNVRAYENTVYYIAVNRVGTERGFTFFGCSLAVNPQGRCLVQAKQNEEELFFVDVDLSLSRKKHQVIIPGELEIDRILDRRPELYEEIVKPLQDNSRIR